MDQFTVPSREGSLFPPAQSREHASFVWESLRDRFTQLYSVENKALAEVMRTLQIEHGFVATYAYFCL
jgi:hypothetical protein